MCIRDRGYKYFWNWLYFQHFLVISQLNCDVEKFYYCQYKYQLNIDGTVAAYRLPYLLAGDSVVLKQDSKYYEFFYKQLKPYEHYIPFKADLSDLLDRIQWAKDHDAEVTKTINFSEVDCVQYSVGLSN